MTRPYFDTEREQPVEVLAPNEGANGSTWRYLVHFPDLPLAPLGYFEHAEFIARFKPLTVEVPYELVVAVRRVVYAQEQRGSYPYPTPVDAAVERLAELAKDVEWPEEWTT